ncbi:MAG: hypothetical protein AB1714_04820 [Acidobacteriota bacterium]
MESHLRPQQRAGWVIRLLSWKRLNTASLFSLWGVIAIALGAAHVLSGQDLPAPIATLWVGKSVDLIWITGATQMESLLRLGESPQGADIVVLDKGELPRNVSLVLRGWIEQGGVVIAFDRAFGSTWRNSDLFGGLIEGADKGWEPPEDSMAFVKGSTVYVADREHPLAQGVDTIYVARDHTMVGDASGEKNAGLGVFDRSVDASTRAILKAQKIGEAVISSRPLQPAGDVTVGVCKQVGKGRVVILPSLDYTAGSTARFMVNLLEWSVSQE